MLMNTEPPSILAHHAARPCQAVLQIQASPQPLPLAHINLDFFFSLLPFSLLHALKRFTMSYSLPFCFSIFMLYCFCSPAPFHKGIFSRNNCACITKNTQTHMQGWCRRLTQHEQDKQLNILAQLTNEARLYGPVITFSCSSGAKNPHAIFCRVPNSAFLETKRKRKNFKNVYTCLQGLIRHL